MELLVVGLDGLSPNMLERFDVAAPFVEATQSDGVSGDLRSVDPPTTLPAWTSFATGKDPGTHGVSTMLQQGRDYDVEPATPNARDAAVYDLLDDAVFVNLPATVGRDPMGDGVDLVPAMLAADAEAAIPAELAGLPAAADYAIEDDTSLKARPDEYIDHLLAVADARYRFASQAFDRCDPRVGFVLFSTTDWVGHFLQHAPDRATAGAWYRQVVERVDEYAGQLSERADNVVLVSDHGFEPKDRAIHLQTWLRNQGYLEMRDHERSAGQRVLTGLASVLADRFEPGFAVARNIYRRLDGLSGSESVGNLVDMNPDVDFENAIAWHLRYGCLYINDDRFAAPTVEHSAPIKRQLVAELSAATDEDGDPVFSDVRLAEEVYADPGPMAPDVIARPATGSLPLRALSPTGSFVRSAPSETFHDHRADGIVAARGPLFADDATVSGMSIVDMLPTLLAALGEPIPPDLDGEARLDVLTNTEPPAVLQRNEVPSASLRDDEAETAAAVGQRLADLGYLE